MEHPQALFSIVKTKAGWFMKCSVNGIVISLSCETDGSRKVATNFR
jgi:hypothetical protein